jgi:hypothetical protein
MIAHHSKILPPPYCKVQPPTVNQQSVPMPHELISLANFAARCPFVAACPFFPPYPMDWKIETRLKGIGTEPEPKPKPIHKPQARPNKLVGDALLSKILKDGKVAKGAYLEVYPKEGERARWFVRVVNGKLKWDEEGNPLISVIRWCKENTTELDAAFLPESCLLGSVIRRVL